jgi:hypothetical protein
MQDSAMEDALTPEEELARQSRIERLETFSETIRKMRQSAIDARKQMGIEDQWQEDEDHYEAIDDANRTTSARTKPYDFGGTGTGPTRLPEATVTRSTVFVPMTRPYVDMASALIADLYLPTDDRNWDGEPTPVPDLVEQAKDMTPLTQLAPAPTGQPAAPTFMGKIKSMFGGQPPVAGHAIAAQIPGQPPVPGAAPQTVGDLAQQEIDKSNEAWKKARTRIDDWLLECQYNAEMRKVIKDMARIGVGIMKGPFPKSKSSKAVVKQPDGYAIEIQEKIIPASRRVDPWRFYPDPACGEDINNGSHTFEEDYLTRSKVRDLRKLSGYIVSQLEKCLEEGPIHATTGTKKSQAEKRNESDLFQVWYFEGQVEWQDLSDAGCEVDGEKGDVFHAVVTMINDHVVKAALSHLDSEEFTYDVSVWQRKSGLWIGDGVGRQGRTAQRGLNAAVRNLMDNAGRSSRPHAVINRSAIAAGPDPYTWYMKGDADLPQVAHAMMFFNVPSMQKELMAIIQYFSKMFEDATGLPMMMQGQQGSAPETVGGMELLMNNASIVPRDIVRRLDDSITEPQINRYYEYLLIHGEDNSEKGDFNIHARGSSALMERAAQDQFLLQIAQFATNPAFGLDPELYIEELLKSKRINPQRLKLSDEKKKALASRPPVEDPRITAAKIMAQSGLQKVQAQGQVDANLQAGEHEAALQQIEHEAAHEQQLLQSGGATPHMASATARIEQERIRAISAERVEASRAHAEESRADKEMLIAQQNGRFKLQEMQLAKDLAVLEYSAKHNLTLEQVKAELAKTAMQEETKRQLASTEQALAASEGDKDRMLDAHKHHNPSPSLVKDQMQTPDTP